MNCLELLVLIRLIMNKGLTLIWRMILTITKYLESINQLNRLLVNVSEEKKQFPDYCELWERLDSVIQQLEIIKDKEV